MKTKKFEKGRNESDNISSFDHGFLPTTQASEEVADDMSEEMEEYDSADFEEDGLEDFPEDISTGIPASILPEILASAASYPILENYQAVVSAFAEFLTVAIHAILYERGIYPRTSFLRARKYDWPVRQSRHPSVCRWILDSVAMVEEEMLKSTVATVSVIIHTTSDPVPIERFVFSIADFPFIPLRASHAALAPPVAFSDLSAQFAAVLSRLSTMCGKLAPLPESKPGECSFTIAMESRHGAPWKRENWLPVITGLQPSYKTVHDRAEVENQYKNESKGNEPGDGGEEADEGEDRSVKEATEEMDKEQEGSRGKYRGGDKSIPIRAVEAGPFVMEVWVEEAKKNQST